MYAVLIGHTSQNAVICMVRLCILKMKHVQKKLFREHCFSQSTETSVYNNKLSLCLTVILNYFVLIFQIIKFTFL